MSAMNTRNFYTFPEFVFSCNLLQKEDGVSLTGSSIIKIILGILFEGFLTSFPSVSGLKSEGGVSFFHE